MIRFEIHLTVRRAAYAERVGERAAEIFAAKIGVPRDWATVKIAPRSRGAVVSVIAEHDWRFSRDETHAIVTGIGAEVDSDRWLVDSLVDVMVSAHGSVEKLLDRRSHAAYDYRDGMREERLAELAAGGRSR